MSEAPDAASAGPVIGGMGKPNHSDPQKRMQEPSRVYDNTMVPMSPVQRRTSEGTTFRSPSMKQIVRPGSRTFI